jgi:hypothetical protein
VTPLRATAQASGAGTSSTITVASAPGDLVVDFIGQGASVNTAGSGQTVLYRDSVTSGSTLVSSAASSAVGAASAVTQTWTFGAVDEWQDIAASAQPAP